MLGVLGMPQHAQDASMFSGCLGALRTPWHTRDTMHKVLNVLGTSRGARHSARVFGIGCLEHRDMLGMLRLNARDGAQVLNRYAECSGSADSAQKVCDVLSIEYGCSSWGSVSSGRRPICLGT